MSILQRASGSGNGCSPRATPRWCGARNGCGSSIGPPKCLRCSRAKPARPSPPPPSSRRSGAAVRQSQQRRRGDRRSAARFWRRRARPTLYRDDSQARLPAARARGGGERTAGGRGPPPERDGVALALCSSPRPCSASGCCRVRTGGRPSSSRPSSMRRAIRPPTRWRSRRGSRQASLGRMDDVRLVPSPREGAFVLTGRLIRWSGHAALSLALEDPQHRTVKWAGMAGGPEASLPRQVPAESFARSRRQSTRAGWSPIDRRRAEAPS